ncbi:C-C motif chemokine 25 [Lampris incognitus]|uniref:C-C motif chemokine 25 n=1 Tax=Lampris incognitus TaxID=2546036 RepID=UPI0024B546A4|nr:C-C motif chemokine 25 [Lampris incognitus]
MQFNLLFLVLVLTSSYVIMAQGSYEDCCLRYAVGLRKGLRRMVAQYRRQEMDGGCNIQAIVFTMKRGSVICADPKVKWVMDLMQKMDNKHHKKRHQQVPKRG